MNIWRGCNIDLMTKYHWRRLEGDILDASWRDLARCALKLSKKTGLEKRFLFGCALEVKEKITNYYLKARK